MKNKEMILGAIAIILVMALIITGVVLMPHKEKDKQDDNVSNENVSKNKLYSLEDKTFENLSVSNMKISVNDNDETVVSFDILNNSEENFTAGNVNVTLMKDDSVLENTSTFIPDVSPNETLRIEIVTNKAYYDITNIEFSK